MLLVHDDEAQRLGGRQDGHSRTHHHACPPSADAPPFVSTFAVAHAAVEHGHVLAEVVPQSVDEGRGQGDLRHQHERATTSRQGGRDGLGVDGGLAAGRVAVEQKGLVASGFDGRADDHEGGLLLRVELTPDRAAATARLGSPGQRPARLRADLELEQATLGQPTHGRSLRVARPGARPPRLRRSRARSAPRAGPAGVAPGADPAASHRTRGRWPPPVRHR